MSLETWLAEWIITKPSLESLDERNSKPQLNLLKTRLCMFYQGRDVAVCVGGSYWFGKYYDGRSPGFLFIITAMSPPFCAGIPGNYNTSNWCFNSSGHHRQVNTRLEVVASNVFSHNERDHRQIRLTPDIIVMSHSPLSLHLSHILPFNTGEKAVLSKPVSFSTYQLLNWKH